MCPDHRDERTAAGHTRPKEYTRADSKLFTPAGGSGLRSEPSELSQADPNREMPVSYTHLDVYKRQGRMFFILTNSRGMTAEVTAAEHERMAYAIHAAAQAADRPYILISRSDSTPVSYTHLDVYKRQLQA